MLRLSLIAIAIMAILLAAIPSLLWVIVWLIGLCFGAHVPFAPFGWTGLAIVVLFLLTMAYGIWIGRFQLEVNQQEFRSEAVPEELDGFKIVHISDLHLSTFDDRPSALQRIVDSINAQEPDIVCFTGDLVSLGVSEALPYANILKGIHAKYGIYSVLGNHDFLIYRRDLQDSVARLREVEQLAEFERNELGWTLLRNENYTIDTRTTSTTRITSSTRITSTTRTTSPTSVTIVGCDNSSCSNQGFQTIYAGDLDKALVGTSGFRILLTHDPSHWREEVAGKRDIPLTLSGHTHAGQVRLFGWPLSSVSFRDNEGWYYSDSSTDCAAPLALSTECVLGWRNALNGCSEETGCPKGGKGALYITRGLGCTMPLRLNCPTEITVITLKKE